ncbi:MAG: ParB/RepB/Spo0J family partition protein [Alphaproteobacteria bacterium]|nr:ParB/RepB/Spo0J family partition protein [Alphaproteobacteria bacterium]
MSQTKELQMIETSKIFILNPRDRNELIRREITQNIEEVGLKRPITVCKKEKPVDGYEYDLVCGQGRLEAYLANGEKEIPAIITNVTQEDALIMSLVENIARRHYNPAELLQGIKRLKDHGYTTQEISEKTGLSREYTAQIGILLDKGETRLIDAVEKQKIPINTAIKIAQASDTEIREILQDAYERNILRGKNLSFMQKLIELRKRNGKSLTSRGGKKLSVTDLNKIFQKEIEKRKLLINKANNAQQALVSLVHGFKVLYRNNNFRTLLRAEKLEAIPKCLIDRIENNE